MADVFIVDIESKQTRQRAMTADETAARARDAAYFNNPDNNIGVVVERARTQRAALAGLDFDALMKQVDSARSLDELKTVLKEVIINQYRLAAMTGLNVIAPERST